MNLGRKETRIKFINLYKSISMKTAEIRERLHQFIDSAADKKVKAMYTIFEENIEANEDYSPEFKAELDKRYEEYQKDGVTISREAMDKRIKKLLNKSR